MEAKLDMKYKHNKFSNLSVGVRASIVYTLASLLSKGLAVITMPIFTRLMSTEQIGIVNLFNSWQSMIGSFATLSLTSGGYMMAMHEFEEKRDQYMSSVLTLTTLISALLMGGYFASPVFWNTITGLPTSLMALMLTGFLVTPATDFWLARQRYEYKYVKAGIITVLSASLASILSVIAVVICSNRNVENIASIRLTVNSGIIYAVALVLWLYIMAKGKTFINLNYWKFSLKLSLPLVGNSIATQILSVSDRTMISKMVDNSAVGIYSTLYSVSSLSLIIWNALNSSFVPFLFENIEKAERDEEIKRVSTQLIAIYSGLALILTLMAPEIVKILATEEYYNAIYIMPPIAGGIFFTAISNMYNNILIYYKKTQFIMISSMTAAALNVIMNYFAIERWGYMAAAYTTLFAYMILGIMQGIVAKRVFTRKNHRKNVYDDKRLIGLSVITSIACLLCLFLYPHTTIRYVVITSLILIGIIFRKRIVCLFYKTGKGD